MRITTAAYDLLFFTFLLRFTLFLPSCGCISHQPSQPPLVDSQLQHTLQKRVHESGRKWTVRGEGERHFGFLIMDFGCATATTGGTGRYTALRTFTCGSLVKERRRLTGASGNRLKRAGLCHLPMPLKITPMSGCHPQLHRRGARLHVALPGRHLLGRTTRGKGADIIFSVPRSAVKVTTRDVNQE